MATNLEKYPIVQLLDNLNNPVSPAVQVNSIYENPGTKNPLDLVYKYESKNLSAESNLVEGDSGDGGKIIMQKETQASNSEGGVPDSSSPNAGPLYIVTDAWVGDGPNDAELYKVDNTLHVRKYNASQLLEWWFEHDYLSKQAGLPIYFGTCTSIPNAVIRDSGTDSTGYEEHGFQDILRPEWEEGSIPGKWYVGRTVDSDDADHWAHPIYKVVDFNTTNFFAPDKYPRRGTIKPSAEYIWFVIDSTKVISQSVKLYGFSGEDNPQEIDIVPIGGLANAWRSAGKFGIDSTFNTNDDGGDGLDYHIFVKYKESQS